MSKRLKPLKELPGKCDFCNKDMLIAVGCETVSYEYEGNVWLKPIPYPQTRAVPCPDCNTMPGLNHHPGCSDERCPNCFGQIITCTCIPQRTGQVTVQLIRSMVVEKTLHNKHKHAR